MSVLLLPDAASKRSETDLTYQLARTPGDRTGAFQLVYRSYLRAGLGEENSFGMRVTKYQLIPTSQIFVGKIRGEVVSTVTLVADGKNGLPMESMFQGEIEELRSAGKKVGEVSCLADRRASPSRFLDAFCHLNRMMAQYARYQGMQCLLITVHPKHARFYRRYFGFKPISERVASCPYVQDRPASALLLDFEVFDREKPECWDDYFGEWMPKDALSPYEIPTDERRHLQKICEQSG